MGGTYARRGSPREWLDRQLAQRDRGDACWEWPFALSGPGGYGRLKNVGSVPRLVLRLTFGEPPDGAWALHSCDNPPCCNPAHLRWGGPSDNAADCTGRGRRVIVHKRGEEHNRAVLTEREVRAIRREHAAGDSYTVLAKRYGVGKTAVADVVRRRTWDYVEDGVGAGGAVPAL